MAAYMVFAGYELKECACANANEPCHAMCTSECATPSTLSLTSTCGQCLLTQAKQGTSSTCTTTAGETDCLPDATCSPFIDCEIGCGL
jgi:hypothetical protein